ncbi:sensor histidine kinase [Streptomyces anthocyanicus]|uniref:sensor histidine kinase n=1 Tax=Streptomyces anthocyanicus TaxID=68174 RepID=UPI003815F3D8
MGRVRVRLPGGLFARLFTVSLLVAVCAVAATAWIAVTGTTRAVRTQQGQSLAEDTRVYDALVGYAATHTGWEGVRGLVDDLAAQTGRPVTVTTQARVPLAGSAPKAGLPSHPTALVDPLRRDPVLSGGGPIDPRAVGPFRLSDEDRVRLRRTADRVARCLWDEGVTADVVTTPSGRSTIRPGRDGNILCDAPRLQKPLPSERLPLERLNELAARCLGREAGGGLKISADLSWTYHGPEPDDTAEDGSGRTAQECVTEARREQLAAHVCPPVLLFVGGNDSRGTVGLSPSTANTLRIAGAAALVLTAAATLTALAGRRLVRPLRALISAAEHPADVTVRVPVTTRDEIGRLSAAFNDLADRRESLERQRKSLVGDVAHELRTPLTNMRSWLEAGQDGLTPVNQDLIALLLEEAVLLQHVIDDLRDLAAADARSLVLHREPLAVGDLLEQVVAAHRGIARPAGVALRIEADGGLTACADRIRLRQVVGNLVSNAVRHTPRGGLVVVRARRQDGDLVIEVADSGTGIVPADLEHVFDRFWRADKSRSRQTGGSGLGLAIVRKLTEAHGGSVTAASTLGAGSVFTVRLPRS